VQRTETRYAAAHAAANTARQRVTELSSARMSQAALSLAKNLRQDLFFKVQDFSFADIDRFSTSSLVTRMTTDVTNVQNAFGMLIRIAVRVPLMIVFSIVMAWRINVKMALIFLGMVPGLPITLAATARQLPHIGPRNG